MISKVDFIEDIVKPYAIILQGAYEKANIWPESELNAEILQEEIEEVQDAYRELKGHIECFACVQGAMFNPDIAQETQGYIISLMCELVQMIAVLNKYKGCEQ